MEKRKAVKREHCPECKGTRMENIVVIENGEMSVYVVCAGCGTNVSKYEVSGYIDAKNPFESILKEFSKKYRQTGKSIEFELKGIDEKLKNEFKEVIEAARKDERKNTILELLDEYGFTVGE